MRTALYVVALAAVLLLAGCALSPEEVRQLEEAGTRRLEDAGLDPAVARAIAALVVNLIQEYLGGPVSQVLDYASDIGMTLLGTYFGIGKPAAAIAKRVKERKAARATS